MQNDLDQIAILLFMVFDLSFPISSDDYESGSIRDATTLVDPARWITASIV